MRILAFIPARAGSKSIPHKNIVLLNGKPLIQYTLDATLKSSRLDSIFVSTDDLAVIGIAQSLGIEVAYRRPCHLAQDATPMIDTILDGLEWLRINRRYRPDAVLLLQPTSPLRKAEDIEGAICRFQETDANSLISVHEMTEHPYECLRLIEGGWVHLAKPDSPLFRRQDYTGSYYYINGAIYLCKTDYLEKKRTFFQEGEAELYIMPAERGIDIDNDFDLWKCECSLRHGKYL